MAFLRNLQTNKKHYLQPHHNFGRRGKSVDTVIESLEISNIHTIIQWDNAEEIWQIKDISRNGTWVDNNRLASTENYPLKTGQIIRFASHAHEGWRVEDLSAPCHLLIPLDQELPAIELSNHELLPNDETPKMAIHLSPETGRWQLEHFHENHEEHAKNTLSHGDHIHCDEHAWELFLIENLAPTANLDLNSKQLFDYQFLFDLSQNEENTILILKHGSHEINLEERTHHYTLLHLARLRHQDAMKGLDGKSQGWVNSEILAKELGLDLSHLNIQIFRARKLFAEKLTEIRGLENLIQRRKGTMRFGCSKFIIYKGDHMECELTDSP